MIFQLVTALCKLSMCARSSCVVNLNRKYQAYFLWILLLLSIYSWKVSSLLVNPQKLQYNIVNRGSFFTDSSNSREEQAIYTANQSHCLPERPLKRITHWNYLWKLLMNNGDQNESYRPRSFNLSISYNIRHKPDT